MRAKAKEETTTVALVFMKECAVDWTPNEQELSGRHTAAQRAAVPVRWSVWLGETRQKVMEALETGRRAGRSRWDQEVRREETS